MTAQPEFMGEYADGYFAWEHTDTFAGQANYCWVKRGLIHAPEPDETWTHDDKTALERRICRAAKRAAGLTGVRCRREDMGDTVAYYPYGSCTVLFVMFGECWIDGTPAEVEAAKAEAVRA